MIEGLYLNGDRPNSKHGPNIYADDVVLRDNEITNDKRSCSQRNVVQGN